MLANSCFNTFNNRPTEYYLSTPAGEHTNAFTCFPEARYAEVWATEFVLRYMRTLWSVPFAVPSPIRRESNVKAMLWQIMCMDWREGASSYTAVSSAAASVHERDPLSSVALVRWTCGKEDRVNRGINDDPASVPAGFKIMQRPSAPAFREGSQELIKPKKQPWVFPRRKIELSASKSTFHRVQVQMKWVWG